ncbi:MAG: ROK family transcriptional regulator, partial [Phycisphaerae bacterium]|nr:ROK family transcriptional regulator [Phycisphaerae bacterium]
MPLSRVSPTDWGVLQVVHRLGATPQHKLATHMGRQPSTVNGAVKRLLSSEWLARVGQMTNGRGRPAILLAVNRTVGCFAGVDVAAKDLHCALVAADGTLLEHASARLSRDHTTSGVMDQIDLNLRGLMSRYDFQPGQLLGIWAGINSPVDEHGVVVTSAALGWHAVPLRGLLAERYGCDVLVQGGSSVMHAAAEALLGAGRNVESLVYFHAGRGISARFVHRGQALTGATERAGEIGHVVVAPGGAKCACGNHGCLEAVSSGPAIAAAIRKLPRRDLPAPLRDYLRGSGRHEAEEIVRLAFKHRPRGARSPLARLLSQVTSYLAMGAAMAVGAYDPQVLVLGGYLFTDNQSLRKGVHAAL